MFDFGIWCVELFKTSCCCAVVLTAYVYLFWLASDTYTSWRGGYRYADGIHFFMGIIALITMIFGGYVLLIAW